MALRIKQKQMENRRGHRDQENGQQQRQNGHMANGNGNHLAESINVPPEQNPFLDSEDFDVVINFDMKVPANADLKTPANIYKFLLLKVKQLTQIFYCLAHETEMWDDMFEEINKIRRVYDEFLDADVEMSDEQLKRVNSAVALFELLERTAKFQATGDDDNLSNLKHWFLDSEKEIQFTVSISLFFGIYDVLKRAKYVHIQKFIVLFLEKCLRYVKESTANGDERFINQYPHTYFGLLLLEKSVHDEKIQLLLDVFTYLADNYSNSHKDDLFMFNEFDEKTADTLMEILDHSDVIRDNIFHEATFAINNEVVAGDMFNTIMELCAQQEEQRHEALEVISNDTHLAKVFENNDIVFDPEDDITHKLAWQRASAYLQFSKFITNNNRKRRHLEFATEQINKLKELRGKNDFLYEKYLCYMNDIHKVHWNYISEEYYNDEERNEEIFEEATKNRIKAGHKLCTFVFKTNSRYLHWETFLEMIQIGVKFRKDFTSHYIRNLIALIKEDATVAQAFTKRTNIDYRKNVVRLFDAIVGLFEERPRPRLSLNNSSSDTNPQIEGNE